MGLVLIGTTLAADLPVHTVILYKHGVGYFEREGQLKAGESARLDFRAADMNDVLKSLTVNDQGGKVTSLRYDSSIPLDQKLADFPFTIGNGFALSALIDQLKGARIEMEFGPQRVAGAVVAARVIAADKEHPEREQLTLLLDSGELRNVDLSAASAIRFTDPKQQAQFRDYLAAVSGARSKDLRSLYIDSTDTGSRSLRAEYMIPMPAWKSSYRLMFEPSGTQAMLEGWAIVDNTTGEDWTNVRMSLVSGKPISFISQLYPPKYVTRQTAGLPEDNAAAPQVYSGVIGGVAEKVPLAAPAPRAAISGSGGGGGFSAGALRAGANLAQVLPSTVAASGEAAELADLFEYSIASPVTVKRDESAMLPFLQQKLATRKVVIYTDISKPNPLNAAEITNNTGKTLDGGPITVYDEGAYAGEALAETVKAGDKRFIGYGVDLGTRIATNLNSRTDDVRELHVHHGMLTARAAQVEKRTYTVRNVDAKAKTLIIEYPVRAGWDLVDTAKPVETARDVYRFEVKLAAGGTAEFPVTAEHVYDNQISISSLTPDILLTYIRNRSLTDAARRQLQQVADLKTQLASGDAERKRLTQQIAEASQDEERNRQNIQSLSPVSGQQQTVQEYARRLSDQEAAILKLRDRQTALEQQQASLQTQLNGLIDRLDF